jgi:flavin reductase (DIM6/NTAB) family NADH-FMN oxidoreductase RutF
VFFEPRQGHGLPHDPWLACVVPRPIGWISTLSTSGVPNLAPFSFFQALQSQPPMVMFSCNGRHADGGVKDSPANAIETGEFVVNMATWELCEAVNLSSSHVAREVDEFELAGLEKAPSQLVRASRVAASPIQLECRTLQHLNLPTHAPGVTNTLVIGEVVGIHIRDEVLSDGLVDVEKIRPLARLGYTQYAVVERVFSMLRPDRARDPASDPKPEGP